MRPAQDAQWGGYFGYFSDLDGYLWKVVAAAGSAAVAGADVVTEGASQEG